MVGALQKSPARAVVVVVMATAATAAVGPLMRAQPSPVPHVCVSHKWFELNSLGKWSRPAAVTAEPQDSDHPVSETWIPWDVVRKMALDQGTKLGRGYPLPVLTCSSFPSPCSASLSSQQARFTRVAQRGVCVAVEGECKTLVVTVTEPTRCHCGEKGITGRIRKVSLLDYALDEVCEALRRPEKKNYLEQSKEVSGLDELPDKQIKEEGTGEEGSGADGSLGEPTETQNQEDKDEDTKGDTGGLSELTEQKLKEDSVLEDIVAAIVFLFVGAVLVMIKNRVFKLTKKKRQQEEKDVESEETLVDETGI